MNKSAETRFWEQVDKTGNCWMWEGFRNGDGYGRFYAHGRMTMTHRFSYEGARGPIPPGLEIDHLCRTRACVNPAHMEPVTHAENVRRGDSWKIHGTKTHCAQGHPYDEENTYLRPSGGRHCRTCMSAWGRAYRARKKASHVR